MHIGNKPVDKPARRRERWDLDQPAFEALLGALHPHRDEAGQRYETLRRKLLRFFEWRGCSDSEAKVDATLDRVSRRLATGEVIQDLDRYCYGVARLVFLEHVRERRLEAESLDEIPAIDAATEAPPNARADCLMACLRALPSDMRLLIVRYYTPGQLARIGRRKLLAWSLGIPMNALRIRAHRARRLLERCVDLGLQRMNDNGRMTAAGRNST